MARDMRYDPEDVSGDTQYFRCLQYRYEDTAIWQPLFLHLVTVSLSLFIPVAFVIPATSIFLVAF
jgi:hypothetical protein